jgi:hypothetical protein
LYYSTPKGTLKKVSKAVSANKQGFYSLLWKKKKKERKKEKKNH